MPSCLRTVWRCNAAIQAAHRVVARVVTDSDAVACVPTLPGFRGKVPMPVKTEACPRALEAAKRCLLAHWSSGRAVARAANVLESFVASCADHLQDLSCMACMTARSSQLHVRPHEPELEHWHQQAGPRLIEVNGVDLNP